MKYLVVLFLITLLGCQPVEGRFKYGEQVEIFGTGVKGVVVGKNMDNNIYRVRYVDKIGVVHTMDLSDTQLTPTKAEKDENEKP